MMIEKLKRMHESALHRYQIVKRAKVRKDEEYQRAREELDVLQRLIKRERDEA